MRAELLFLRHGRLRACLQFLTRNRRQPRLELLPYLRRPAEADVCLIRGLRRWQILLLFCSKTEVQRCRTIAWIQPDRLIEERP